MVYIAVFIVGMVCFSSVFMLYKVCTTLVAGEPLLPFSLSYFFDGMHFSFFLCALFAIMFLSLYLVRHPSSSKMPVGTVIVLGAATWFLFVPFLQKNYFGVSLAVSEKEPKNISAGYFRTQGDKIFYYASVAQDMASGVEFLIPASESKSLVIRTFADRRLEKTESEPFADPLIRDSLRLPMPVARLLQGYAVLEHQATLSINSGYITWLCFASMGVAFLSVIILIYGSVWRMINSFSIMFCSLFIFWMNGLYYGTSFLSGFKNLCRKIPLYFIPDRGIVFLNLGLAIVISMTGLLIVLRKRAKTTNEVLG